MTDWLGVHSEVGREKKTAIKKSVSTFIFLESSYRINHQEKSEGDKNSAAQRLE